MLVVKTPKTRKNMSNYIDVNTYMPQGLYFEMMHYVNKAPAEVGGLGTFAKSNRGREVTIVINSLELVPQVAPERWLEVQYDDEGFVRWLVDKGYMKKGMIVEDVLLFWWHSHVTGAVSPSFIDLNCIDRLVEFKGAKILTLIVNKLGDASCRLDYNTLEGMPVVCDTSFEVAHPKPSEDELNVWNAKYDKLVVTESLTAEDKERKRLEEQAKGEGRFAEAARKALERMVGDRKCACGVTLFTDRAKDEGTCWECALKDGAYGVN